MAEQNYKDTLAVKKAMEVTDSGFRFDPDLCREIFDDFDRDGSGYLDIGEVSRLAEVDPCPDPFFDAFEVPDYIRTGAVGHFSSRGPKAHQGTQRGPMTPSLD